MTIGTAAKTRLSTAAVVQVVQPLFEAPATINFSTFIFFCPANSVIASIALTAPFVIGNLSKIVGSFIFSTNVFL